MAIKVMKILLVMTLVVVRSFENGVDTVGVSKGIYTVIA